MPRRGGRKNPKTPDTPVARSEMSGACASCVAMQSKTLEQIVGIEKIKEFVRKIKNVDPCDIFQPIEALIQGGKKEGIKCITFVLCKKIKENMNLLLHDDFDTKDNRNAIALLCLAEKDILLTEKNSDIGVDRQMSCEERYNATEENLLNPMKQGLIEELCELKLTPKQPEQSVAAAV